jgi:hypothetical protein
MQPKIDAGQISALVSCDTQVMNRQNACVVIGPTIGAANPAGNAPLELHDPTTRVSATEAATDAPRRRVKRTSGAAAGSSGSAARGWDDAGQGVR